MIALPFIVLAGAWTINHIPVNDDAKMFASLVGGAAVCFNLFIGISLMITGHKQIKTFEGW